MKSTETIPEQELQWANMKATVKEMVLSLLDKYNRPANEIILDDVDLRAMLKISRRTALSYRQSGKIVFYKIENKIFYFLSDVLAFIKKAGEN